MKVKVLSRNRNLLNTITSLGEASYSISLFGHLPLGNKLGEVTPRVRARLSKYDSICIIVIGTYFSLIKSLCSLKLQIWFYHHKIDFIYPFVLEQINL